MCDAEISYLMRVKQVMTFIMLLFSLIQQRNERGSFLSVRCSAPSSNAAVDTQHGRTQQSPSCFQIQTRYGFDREPVLSIPTLAAVTHFSTSPALSAYVSFSTFVCKILVCRCSLWLEVETQNVCSSAISYTKYFEVI